MKRFGCKKNLYKDECKPKITFKLNLGNQQHNWYNKRQMVLVAGVKEGGAWTVAVER